MFWRERERENKELNGGPPCGQVRVLVVGDSGEDIFRFISSVQRPQRLDENSSDDDRLCKRTSLSSDPSKYNILPPLPAQRNLTPPPTLYPQQPV